MSNLNDFDLPADKKTASKKATNKALEDKAMAAVDETAKKDEGDQKSKPEYDAAELLAIFDEMIFSGEYSETISIRGGKLKVAFKTRSSEEIENISKIIDTTDVKLMSTLVEKRSLLNLHYALTHYQGKDLGGLKLEDRAAFINKLPSPVVGLLFVELGKFDDKVFAACKEGEENF